MKRLSVALIAFATAPRLFAGASVFFEDKDFPHRPDSVSDLPDVEVVSEKESRAVTSAVPFHEIDIRKISTSGITDISDALKRMPGVNLRDYGGAGGLKTVSVRGLGARHTGVSYDGVALSEVRSGEIDLAAYSLENVATLSLVAGDNEDIFIPARNAASAAAISISTLKNPELSDRKIKLEARLKTGSYKLWNPFLRIGFSNGSNLSLSAITEFKHAKNDYPFTLINGDIITRERRNNSQMNSLHSEINSVIIPYKGASINTKLYYYDNSRQLPGPVRYYVFESNEHLHDRNFFAQTRYRAKFSSLFSFSAIAKFNWAASRYTDVAGSYPGGKLDQAYYQREAYLSTALLFLPVSSLAIDYSADWFYNNLSSNLPSDSRPFRNSGIQSVTARYSSDHFVLTGRLLHSLFIDRSHRKSESGKEMLSDRIINQKFSPSLSCSYRPTKELPLFVRASYKNIFRVPTFTELYFDNYGSVDLKPEKTDQLNMGLTFSAPQKNWLSDLTLTADWYVNFVTDKIVAIPFNLFKWTMTNLGKARIYGIDLTLNAEVSLGPLHSVLFSGSYSYQRAQPRTSPDMLDWMKQVAYTPLNSGAGSLSWINPWVSPVIHFTAASARYTTNANLPSTRIPGYADFGLSAFHTFNFHTFSLELRGDIMNILNKQYEIVARYPMPGRSWQASIQFKF